MVREKITPEERLLRVIDKPPKFKKISSLGIKDWFILKKEFLVRIWTEKRFFELKLLNKALMILCILITIFFMGDFSRLSYKFGNKMKVIERVKKLKDIGSKEKTLKVDLKNALLESKRRNIFIFPSKDKEQRILKEAPSVNLDNLKLVGIIWSDNSQVLIEDIKKKKTYLLSPGDSIEDLKIKKIKKDSVVLEKDNKEVILR